MQHEPRCPALGAREPRQGDYDDDGVAQQQQQQVLSPLGCRSENSVVLDTRNAVARNVLESCHRRRRRRAHPEVAHTWHSSSSDSSSNSENRRRRRRRGETGERHKVVVQEVQVARQEEEAEAEVVDRARAHLVRPPLPPSAPLPPSLSSRELVLPTATSVVVVVAAAAATTATTAAAAAAAANVSGRGTLVQGNF